MKKCKQGYYYCYKDKKCKRIPGGYRVGLGGYLRREREEERSEDTGGTETKKNGNGNGNGGNGGNGNGGNGGGVSEAVMSPAQKRKDTMLKKKYDKSDMKQNMIDQYGKEEGTKIYFATIRKQAMKEGWSDKYKKSIDCDNPKGFSQKAHCQGRKKKMNEEKKKDHEYSMARSELKTIKNAASRLEKKMGKTGEGELKAWVQSKITKAADYIDTAADYVTNEETCPICGHDPCQCLEGVITEKRDGKSSKDKGYSLRDWFKGGGWKQTGGKYDGKPCAKQPGQKTKPYCRDADDRAAMSKEERNKRAAKKRKEDPNPNRKGKAKNVTQESYSNWRTEFFEGYDDGDIIRPTDRIRMKDGKLRTLKDIDAKLKDNKPVQKNSYEPEGELVDEGKKDACYHKVKSRYSVWPSAYASGALVKCRKVGAKNWGNKSKKNESVDYSNWRDDFIPTEYETTDLIKADPIQVPPSNLQKIEEAKKCWKGYKKTGTQKLFGKTYNRCEKIKKEHYDWRAELEEGAAWTKKSGKNPSGGLNEKGRKSYERENPGSDLKRPSKKVGNKRRASFCARMKGMKKKLTSKKTANDPNSRINKSLRAWNC